jgi:DNA-binding MarR family transcriptional regulator
MKPKALSAIELDKTIHERSRLMVLTYLSSSTKGEAGFTEIRDALGFTGGNLSVQIRTLEDAGYVAIDKRFVENKSYTGVSLTPQGHKALSAYIEELETIVASLKGAAGKEDSNVEPSSRERDEGISQGR